MNYQTETSYGPPRTSGMAIASLVLGVLGIVFTLLTAIPGLILGIVALVQIKGSGRQLTGSGLAIAGIVLSILTPLIILALVLPVFMQARDRAMHQAPQGYQRSGFKMQGGPAFPAGRGNPAP